MTKSYDAIIVGGGPSGATAAALLAQAGWRGCRRREGAVPAAQSVWRVHFGNDMAAVAAVGHCRSFAGNRRTSGAPRRRLRRRGDGDGGTGFARRPRGRAAAERWAASTSIRCCASVPPRPGPTVWQPCTLSAFVAIDGGYECTIVDKGTRQSRALRSRLIIAAHGSWESGAMPTQDLRRAAARLGSVRLQGAFSQRRTAHGPDAVARISRRLWRNGAHRWRSRQPVVLHSSRPARSTAGDNGRTYEPGRRSSRISSRRARVSRWRCLRRRWTVPGCLPGRCGREFAPSAAMASSRSAMRQPKRTPSSPKASAWPFNPRPCCAGN